MEIKLLHHTPLWVASTAIRKCWASEGKSDSYEICSICGGTDVQVDYCSKCMDTTLETVCGPKDRDLIERIGNKNKHKSTLEHLVYSFDIDGISRACLQEVARHRIASYSVKSTRYTLKELSKSDKLMDFLVPVDPEVNNANVAQLRRVKESTSSNDIKKYMLPEAYKTSLVMTINARSLQNFLSLRTNKAALWEIRDLANEMFNQLPEDHKYLFEDCIATNE